MTPTPKPSPETLRRVHDLVARTIADAAECLDDRVRDERLACRNAGFLSETIEIGDLAVEMLQGMAKAHFEKHVRSEFAELPLFKEAM